MSFSSVWEFRSNLSLDQPSPELEQRVWWDPGSKTKQNYIPGQQRPPSHVQEMTGSLHSSPAPTPPQSLSPGLPWSPCLQSGWLSSCWHALGLLCGLLEVHPLQEAFPDSSFCPPPKHHCFLALIELSKCFVSLPPPPLQEQEP